MKKIVSALVVCGMVGCIQWSPSNTHHYNIYISDEFSAEQTNAIMEMSIEWQQALGGFITFGWSSDDTGEDTISFYSVESMPQVQQQCGDPNSIGCEFSDGTKEHIYMSVSGLDPITFKQTAGHELGHSLGMMHIAPGNLLCSNKGCASLHVECGDVREIQKEWGSFSFNADVLPICKGK